MYRVCRPEDRQFPKAPERLRLETGHHNMSSPPEGALMDSVGENAHLKKDVAFWR